MQTRSQIRRRSVASIIEWLRNFVRSKREPNAEDFLFVSQIDTATLNRVCPEGPNKCHSVAIFLAATRAGQAILAHGNPSLGSQITAATLNQVIEEKGYSVASFLASTPEG
jgi:hypothetical protein